MLSYWRRGEYKETELTIVETHPNPRVQGAHRWDIPSQSPGRLPTALLPTQHNADAFWPIVSSNRDVFLKRRRLAATSSFGMSQSIGGM